jgi:hypothetical protein
MHQPIPDITLFGQVSRKLNPNCVSHGFAGPRIVHIVLISIAFLVASPLTEAQTYSLTGSMTTGRYDQTATLLNDGTVLVAGGCAAGSDCLSSAEIYNVTTGEFTNTSGAMETKRWGHTATLLQSGLVLITGGCTGGGSCVNTAELYNPASGTFSPVGNMTADRYEHTATLLNNGYVLITGGCTGGGACLNTAELYNPATETFAATTGTMESKRYEQTATLLFNGDVLIAGGCTGGGSCLSTAELYNPATETFSPTSGNMSVSRYLHTASIVGAGNVLLAGGCSGGGSCNASADLYNATSETFSTGGTMNVARYAAAAANLYDGTVLISGGCASSDNCTSSADIYYPSDNSFSTTGGMSTKRYSDTATLLNNGDVLTVGGCTGGGSCPDTAELYHGPPPATGILYPGFKILSIVYSTPGNRSSNGFTNTTTDGTTNSFGSNFQQGVSETFSINGGFLGVGDSMSWSFGESTTQGTNSQVTDTVSEATGVANATNSAAPNSINHQQDMFIIWVNPAVLFTQTGLDSVSYSIGTEAQTTGDPNPGQPEIIDSLEVFAQAMLPNAQGNTTVPLSILEPVNINGQTLPGLACLCKNQQYYPSNCAADPNGQCGCVPSDFAPILAADPVLNYTPTQSPLDADTSGTECANPTSTLACRYVPVLSGGQQENQLLEGPNDPGGNIPVNTFGQSDSTMTTNTFSQSFAYNTSYSWKVQLSPYGSGVDLTSTDTFTWSNSESAGESNGSAHAMTVTLSSSTVACKQEIPIWEDSVYHTYLFTQPAGNNTCP